MQPHLLSITIHHNWSMFLLIGIIKTHLIYCFPPLLCSLGKFSYTWISFFREKEILVTRAFTNTNLLFTLEEWYHKTAVESNATLVLWWLICTWSLFFLYAAHFWCLKNILILHERFSLATVSNIYCWWSVLMTNRIAGEVISWCTSHRPSPLRISNAYHNQDLPTLVLNDHFCWFGQQPCRSPLLVTAKGAGI